MSENILKILLIEDDAGDAILVERTLQRCRQRFAIHHCELLEDAVQLLATGRFDVALLDLSLRDAFGIAGVNRLHACSPDLPIVVLTGLSDDDLAIRSLEQGAQDYLVKGQATSELLERTLRYAIQRQQIQSENRLLMNNMEKLARQDPLTGVLNRHSFDEQLKREWNRLRRYGSSLACVMLDIDFFKRINDTYGHATGDQTLKDVAKTIAESTRGFDLVGRLGGEEFCIVLTECNEEAAAAWAERARKAIANLVIEVNGHELRITASLGVSVWSHELSGPAKMVEQADEALMVAKQLGRNQVTLYSRLHGLARPNLSSVWEGVTAKDLAVPIEATIPPELPIGEAIRILQSEHAESLPVITDEGQVAGMVGQDDIVAATLTMGLNHPINDVMQTRVVNFPAKTPAHEVAEFFRRAAVRQVFLVDDNRPVGVIHRTRLFERLSSSLTANAGIQTV